MAGDSISKRNPPLGELNAPVQEQITDMSIQPHHAKTISQEILF